MNLHPSTEARGDWDRARKDELAYYSQYMAFADRAAKARKHETRRMWQAKAAQALELSRLARKAATEAAMLLAVTLTLTCTTAHAAPLPAPVPDGCHVIAAYEDGAEIAQCDNGYQLALDPDGGPGRAPGTWFVIGLEGGS